MKIYVKAAKVISNLDDVSNYIIDYINKRVKQSKRAKLGFIQGDIFVFDNGTEMVKGKISKCIEKAEELYSENPDDYIENPEYLIEDVWNFDDDIFQVTTNTDMLVELFKQCGQDIPWKTLRKFEE